MRICRLVVLSVGAWYALFTTCGVADTVYRDALNTSWSNNWSWDTRIRNVTRPVRSGTSALAVMHSSAWAGLYLRRNEALQINTFKALRFALHGGGRGGQVINVSLHNSANQASATVRVNGQRGRWQRFEIALSEFAPVGDIAGLVWQDGSGRRQRQFYLDDVELVPATGEPQDTLRLTIDADQINGAISPLIYGMSFAEPSLASELELPLRRWGGNATSRYNYLNDTSNRASDWYFLNVPNDTDDVLALPDNSAADRFVEENALAGAETIMTMPMLGWLPKRRAYDCGFRVSSYGAQTQMSPYRPDCGNGVRPNGSVVTGNDPRDTSIEVDEAFVTDWVHHLLGRFDDAANGGVALYSLDNEPMLWSDTHRDVHPEPTSYDELGELGVRYARAIKDTDPSASTLGPGLWGWTAYFYSALDAAPGGAWWEHPADRLAHGNLPLAAWYLEHMQQADVAHNERLLDYFDLHFYPQGAGVFSHAAGDAATQALRLRATRALWDSQYTDESWINEPVMLIPRMRAWVDTHYPGTKIALSEYSFGALTHINGALAQADALGIFGREQLDLAALWDPPAADEPGAFAFRMYLNYDGNRGRFGDVSVTATSSDDAALAVYGALRNKDGALTLIVINKTKRSLNAQVDVGGFSMQGRGEVYRYDAASSDRIVREPDITVVQGTLSKSFPAESISHIILPTQSATASTGRMMPSNSCWPTAVPVGALPSQPGPVFCALNASGPGTAVTRPNRWLDDFDHGLSFADFNATRYTIYETQGNVHRSIHWRHANHWMVDLVPLARNADRSGGGATGGALIKPNKRFRFNRGKLVVEADFASAISAYGHNSWGEIVVSSGKRPGGFRVGGSLYAYDLFPGEWTLGCRLQTERVVICALLDDTERGTLNGGRVWEMSFFQRVGRTHFGGGPWVGGGRYWRACGMADADTNCRDRFRLELTATSVTLFVNGYQYFKQTGIARLPSRLLNGPVSVYLGSMTSRSAAETLRYHWDRIAINPRGPRTAAPGFSAP